MLLRSAPCKPEENIMKKAVALLGLLLLVGSLSADTTMIMKANIPFDFVAGKTAMTAGDYQFMRLGEDAIEIKNLSTNKVVVVQALTRLAAEPSSKARVTFDVVGDKRMLESVWPGVDDGYLLGVTKQKHTHHTVPVS
jgi:hypothetical protein